ncbi:protein mono-ADP-ribosyltransferase PARP16-like, partial [Drosophila navojoa]|uniref:protein mono-ADP-ribosyltransferase PARP16-like n=1 Tax=Drosophila navojoa TaxID=7232 RepID=UPI0011BE9C2F
MENERLNCRCSRRGRICVCVPRNHVDPSLIQVMNEARRLRVMEELAAVLERDLMGVDAKWVLFTMAVQSYRYEQLVVPFPPAYATPTGLNIDSLSFVTGTMTELATYQRRLMQKLLPPEQVQLMHWLLVQSDTPQLRQVQRHDQPELWRQLAFKPDPRPHLIFRVVPKGSDDGSAKPLDPASCLFYGGDMEELFAMMSAKRYDLNQSELEFYDDLETAANMAEWCPGWGYSICGTLLRCVAVCQLHEHKRLQVRYLLFYSMCYTKQMQAVRRRQWKSRRSALVVLGALTLASLTLVATNMRQ